MSPRGPSWKWWVCGALLLATMLNYMDRLTLAITATQLKTEIALADDRYGTLEEWFSYAFAAGGIFFGFVADRVGPRRLYPIVLIGWSLAAIASSLADRPIIVGTLGDAGVPGQGEFRWLFVCRTVLGFFEAGHWPCALITARNILTAAQRPLGNSILQSGAAFGSVLTPLVIEAIRAVGAPWQGPFLIIGLLGLAWVPLWYYLVGAEDLNYRPAERTPASAGTMHVGRLAFQCVVLVVIVVTISLAWQFQRAWLPKYLKEFQGYPESEANYFTSAFYLVASIGSLLLGGAVTLMTGAGVNVRWAQLLVFAGCAGLVALSALVPQMERGPLLLLCLMVMGAGSLGAHPLYYALVQELPTRHMGVLSGVLAATSWVAVGRMQGTMGFHIKATGSYDLPLLVTGLAPLAGLAALASWVVLTRSSARTPV